MSRIDRLTTLLNRFRLQVDALPDGKGNLALVEEGP